MSAFWPRDTSPAQPMFVTPSAMLQTARHARAQQKRLASAPLARSSSEESPVAGGGGRDLHLSHLSSERRPMEPLGEVAGRVVALSHHPLGCRILQDALERTHDGAHVALASELRGHVWAAARCPHANHVLQKCVKVLPSSAASFIREELAQGPGVGEAARHRFGCRVLERLVESCGGERGSLVDGLAADAAELFAHPCGNFVVQCLLEHAPRECRVRVQRVLEQRIHVATTSCHARAVISKALVCAQGEELASLARALCGRPGVLQSMACTRHGHKGVLHLIKNLESSDAPEVRRQLKEGISTFEKMRFGRTVVAALAGA